VRGPEFLVGENLTLIVTTGLVPVVHAEARWIAGTSPAMKK
jgi:hypothetical protein